MMRMVIKEQKKRKHKSQNMDFRREGLLITFLIMEDHLFLNCQLFWGQQWLSNRGAH